VQAAIQARSTSHPQTILTRKATFLVGICLFFAVLHASWPDTSGELETLQFLIKDGADLFLRDTEGYTIFDYVDEEEDKMYGSYPRDLWYSALHERMEMSTAEHQHGKRFQCTQVSTSQFITAPCAIWMLGGNILCPKLLAC
jgi:hypothetical protein